MHVSKKYIYLSLLSLFILGGGLFSVWVKTGMVKPDGVHATYVQVGEEVVYATIVDLTSIDTTTQSRVYGTEAFFIMLADTESAPSLGLLNQPVDIIWVNESLVIVEKETVTLTQEEQTLSPPETARYGLVTRTGVLDDTEKTVGEQIQLTTSK